MKKGASAAPFLTGEASYRFLPAFFFPPLAFFAIVSYPPLHVGFACASAPTSIQWLPPGTRTRRSSPGASGILRASDLESLVRKSEVALNLTRDGLS
jgi:hypothetical protein